MKKIHFISGLPRSGSTLLCNILAQNPRFHSTHTSGCLDVLFGVRNHWHGLIEHKAHPDDGKLLRVLRAILEAYHELDVPVVFDKSRGWTQYLGLAEEILGRRVKVLVPTRPIPDVLASMEKLHRETAKTRQPPGERENYFQMQTVAGRCENWMRPDGVVGLAHARIRNAIQCGFADRMYVVLFAELTKDPLSMLRGIYSFLGEEWFPHDFANVEQVTQEDDVLHGYSNLHTIREKVEFQPSRAVEILGPQLASQYSRYNLER